MCYDSILFGNGLTINLLNQLKPFIPPEYSYLLTFDGFMSAFINGTLPNTILMGLEWIGKRHCNI